MARRMCEQCGFPLAALARSHARFCSTRCRVAAHRGRQSLPPAMVDRRAWTRRVGKRPMTTRGRAASSTDPTTWSSYADASTSRIGDGLGIMLGDGLACYDLDHCLSDGRLSVQAAEILRSVEPIWVERSMSGDGLHVFVSAPEGPGSRTAGVEFYSRARFIAVTGDSFRG